MLAHGGYNHHNGITMSQPAADLPPATGAVALPTRRDQPGGSLSPDAPPPPSYDALLLVSFGGPEGPDEVMPFLESVARGKNVPHERLREVARHYELFGGVKPGGRSDAPTALRAGHGTEHARSAAAGLLGQLSWASVAGRGGRRDGRRRCAAGLGVCYFGVRFLSRLRPIRERHGCRPRGTWAMRCRRSRNCGCFTIIPASLRP